MGKKHSLLMKFSYLCNFTDTLTHTHTHTQTHTHTHTHILSKTFTKKWNVETNSKFFFLLEEFSIKMNLKEKEVDSIAITYVILQASGRNLILQ